MTRYASTTTTAGPFEAAADVFNTGLDILTGGPQKRGRIARDQRRAAEAMRDAAAYEARTAQQVAQFEAQQQRELLRTAGVYGLIGLGGLVFFLGRRG